MIINYDRHDHRDNINSGDDYHIFENFYINL